MAESRTDQIVGVAVLFIALTWLFVLLRVYCRVKVVRAFGVDDCLAVLTQIIYTVFMSFVLIGTKHGNGQHTADIIPASEFPVGLKWWWACEPTYVLANMTLKLSIGIFLLRICVSRTHKWIIYIVLAVVEIYSAFFFLLFILQCRPSSYFWTQYTGGEGSCIDPKVTVNAFYGYSVISCVADWTLGLLPIALVWNLQMNRRTKLTVALILAVGSIASTATIVRIPYIRGMSDFDDFLYATVDVAIWSIAETGIGIAASCAATLRPLFRDFFDRSNLGASSGDLGSHWPRSKSNAHYIRSTNNGGAEEFGLRSDISKRIGVTTVVEGNNPDGHMDVKKDRDNMPKGERGWGTSETRLADDSSEEFTPQTERSWRGIQKTIVSTQTTY